MNYILLQCYLLFIFIVHRLVMTLVFGLSSCYCPYLSSLVRPKKWIVWLYYNWSKKIGSVGQIFYLFFPQIAFWKQKMQSKLKTMLNLMFKFVTWCLGLLHIYMWFYSNMNHECILKCTECKKMRKNFYTFSAFFFVFLV